MTGTHRSCGYWLWAAVLCCSVLWLFAWHVTLSPSLWGVVVLLAAAVACAALGLRHTAGLGRIHRGYLVLLVPLGAACGLVPLPMSLGAWVLAVGLIAAVTWRARPQLAPLAFGALLVGAMLAAQAPLRHLADVVSARSSFGPPINRLTYLVLGYLGVPVTFDGAMPHVRTMRFLFGLPASWERIGLVVLLNVLAGGLIVTALFVPSGRRLRAAGWLVVTTAAYFVLRYVVVVVAFVNAMYLVDYFSEQYKMWIFWHPLVMAATLAPLVWVLGRLLPLDGSVDASGAFAACWGDWRHRAAAGTIGVAALLAVGIAGYHDPGARKPGRLMMDETHSGWEKATRPYDETWYGNESGYNYYCASQLLGHYYDFELNTERDLTRDYLKQFDVALLKNPTVPYSGEEERALVEFVRNGGGVFLMGEHTNVFGTTHPLNQLAKRFGFFFRYDCVFDIERKFEQFYQAPRLLRHPAIANMDEFLFATSCSIEPTRYGVDNVILGHGAYSLPIQYASGNFYPQVNFHSDMQFGTVSQMVAATHGRGRVIGFSDSTCFSNFSCQNPSKPELLLSSVEWLNRSNRFTWLPSVMWAGLVVAMVASVALLRAAWPTAGVGLVSLALAMGLAAVGAEAFTSYSLRTYAPREPVVKPLVAVAFDREHADFAFPLRGFVPPEDNERAYTIFYQWVLRLSNGKAGQERIGYYPFMRYTLRDTLATAGAGGLAVIIRPRLAFQEPEVAEIKEFLETGGKLLVLDGPENKVSSANALLEPLGMALRRGQQPQPTHLMDSTNKIVCALSGSDWVEGGTPLLWNSQGQPVLAVTSVGSGTLCVMAAAGRFADAQMGYSQSNPPGPDLLPVYALQFRLIKGLVEGTLEATYPPKR